MSDTIEIMFGCAVVWFMFETIRRMNSIERRIK